MLKHLNEVDQSQLPMVLMLIGLGYSYLSKDELETYRGNDSTCLLKGIAIESLERINQDDYQFKKEDIAEAVDELENIQFEGLIDTSKNIYNIIMPLTGVQRFGLPARVNLNQKI